MPKSPSAIAAESFRVAAGEAALFELEMRMRAGTIPTACDLQIDSKMPPLLNAILEHHKSALTKDDKELLSKACNLRNKLMHCEFSAARERLNDLDQKPRSGGVTVMKVSDDTSLEELVSRLKSGPNGPVPVADTKTKTLKDVFGWLLECYGAGEFEEAAATFRRATALLERLGRGGV